jgi:hypothetical protein
MEEVMLAIDVVLQAIIGRNGSAANLIEQARRGEILLVVPHSVLYCAIYSISSTDTINTSQLAALLRYSQILPDSPEYLGPDDRDSWRPNSQAVENWRRLALKDD